MSETKINAMPFNIGIMLASFGILRVLADIADAQTVYHEPGLVNTEFSRGCIFFEKSGPVRHLHAIKRRLKKGYWTSKGHDERGAAFDKESLMKISADRNKSFCLKSETDFATREKGKLRMLGSEVLECRKYPGAQFDRITLEYQ